jgi:hypothetical protein
LSGKWCRFYSKSIPLWLSWSPVATLAECPALPYWQSLWAVITPIHSSWSAQHPGEFPAHSGHGRNIYWLLNR